MLTEISLMVGRPMAQPLLRLTSNYLWLCLATNAGFTASRDTPNYTPYFTCPFNNDTCTAGGPNGVGVSHDGFRSTNLKDGQNYAYKVNRYGVSSLGFPTGVTTYIKVCVNDFNYTQTLQITSGQQTGFSLFTQKQLLDTALVPTTVYEEFFGPTSSSNNNIAVIRFTNNQARVGTTTSSLVSAAADGGWTGHIVIGLTAYDDSGVSVGGFTSGATANGIRFVVRFDRA
jgi:hypothetical protein